MSCFMLYVNRKRNVPRRSVSWVLSLQTHLTNIKRLLWRRYVKWVLLTNLFNPLETVSIADPATYSPVIIIITTLPQCNAYQSLRSPNHYSGVAIKFSFFFPFGFQYRRWGEFVEVSIRFIFCDHAFKSHDQPVLWSFVITRRNFKLITLTAQSLNMGIKGMDKAKSPHDKGVLITGVGNTRSFLWVPRKQLLTL